MDTNESIYINKDNRTIVVDPCERTFHVNGACVITCNFILISANVLQKECMLLPAIS